MCLGGFAGKTVFTDGEISALLISDVVMPLELIGAMWWPTVPPSPEHLFIFEVLAMS